MLVWVTTIKKAPSHSKNTLCFRGKFFWEVTPHFPVLLCNAVMLFWVWSYFTYSVLPVVSPFSLRGSLPLGIVFTKFQMQSYHTMPCASEEPKKKKGCHESCSIQGTPATILVKRLDPSLYLEQPVYSQNTELNATVTSWGHWSLGAPSPGRTLTPVPQRWDLGPKHQFFHLCKLFRMAPDNQAYRQDWYILGVPP